MTAVIFLCVQIFYKFTETHLECAPLHLVEVDKQAFSSLKQETHRNSLTHYNAIAERNLFNVSDEIEQKTAQVDIEALEQTELKLKLLGTVTGSKDKAYAVIEQQKEKQQDLYRIGDSIQNATVKMILREKVILSVNGKDEILEMEQEDTGKQSEKDYKKPSKVHSKNIRLTHSQIKDSMKNINSLMKEVRIRPHFSGGKPDGLSLTGIKPNSIFKKMGLRNGDIIMGVDGENIESVDDAITFYNSLKSSSDVELQIKRRGKQQTINYSIEE